MTWTLAEAMHACTQARIASATGVIFHDMGWLKVLRGNEEEKYAWHPDSPSETQAARDRFDQYMKHGFIACKIVDRGKRGIPLTKFDPEAEEIFMLELADGG